MAAIGIPPSPRDRLHRCALPERGPVIAGPSHEADHGAVRIDESVSRAETAADDVVAAHLRKHATNFVAPYQSHVLQSHGDLLFVIRPQVSQMLIAGGAEKIALRAIVT